METKWLEDFVSLAETRSFSRSAQLRHVTQPAFSRRIQALEAWAGTDLVDRSSYPTRLTAAGETPVSYTHLDVYKRQLPSCAANQLFNRCGLVMPLCMETTASSPNSGQKRSRTRSSNCGVKLISGTIISTWAFLSLCKTLLAACK